MCLRFLLRMYRTVSYEKLFLIQVTFSVSKLHRCFAHNGVTVLRLSSSRLWYLIVRYTDSNCLLQSAISSFRYPWSLVCREVYHLPQWSITYRFPNCGTLLVVFSHIWGEISCCTWEVRTSKHCYVGWLLIAQGVCWNWRQFGGLCINRGKVFKKFVIKSFLNWAGSEYDLMMVRATKIVNFVAP
jgi:hypothetical protein